MKVKFLIEKLKPYEENKIGIWDDGSFLNIEYIEKYKNNIIGLGGSYKNELDYNGLETETIYEEK